MKVFDLLSLYGWLTCFLINVLFELVAMFCLIEIQYLKLNQKNPIFYFFFEFCLYLSVQLGYKNPTNIILFKTSTMDSIKGYKIGYEKKKQILYSRMDDSMILSLRGISKKTGISVSELIRESVRRLLQEVDETGSINLKLN